MDRRTVLRTAGAALAGGTLPAIGAAADPYAPLGHLSLPGTREVVVGPEGRTAFAAVYDGFATVDVSDPSAPVPLAERRDLLAEREEGPMERVQDVAVDGDRLAVAGPAHGGGISGVILYDVSDPASPRRVAFHETEWPVHNCDVAGDDVYLTENDYEGNPLVVLAAGDGTLAEVGRWSIARVDEDWLELPSSIRTLHDVTAVDDVAYCNYWDAGTWLVDVSDPTEPAAMGRVGGQTASALLAMEDTEKAYEILEPPGNAHSAAIGDDGRLLAVGGESWDAHRGDGHGGPSGVDLWDVSDPAAPEHRASIAPFVPRDATYGDGIWTTVHNFELAGDRLYSAWYQDGVKLHDVSDPSQPTLLAHWRTPAETRFWTAQVGRRGEFFVASDMGFRDGVAEDGGLYCFPDRAGVQADQPAIATPTPTPTATGTGDGSGHHGGTPTDTPSPTATRSPTETETTTPGFGVLGALGGLGVAAARALRD